MGLGVQKVLGDLTTKMLTYRFLRTKMVSWMDRVSMTMMTTSEI